LVAVASAVFVAGTFTAGCPGGRVVTPAGSGPGWADEAEPLVEVWAGVVVDFGAAVDAFPTVLPSRKPRIAPRSRPTTPTRAAMAIVVDWSASPEATAGAAGLADFGEEVLAAAGAAGLADAALAEDDAGFLLSGSSSKKKSWSLTWIPYLPDRFRDGIADPLRETTERWTERSES
jgi:hypothetical protein